MIGFNLYVITNRHLCTPKPLRTVIAEVLDVGVKAIQLREKDLDDVALFQLAHPIAALCKRYNAQLFINTNVQVAVDVGAAGVHLPDSDKSIDEVKALSDVNLLIGCSIHSVDSAKKRETEGADFITYSPIFQTTNKQGYGQVVGVDNLEKLVRQVKIPVFSLGGVIPINVGECLQVGASGVAVMSGIMSLTDAGERAQDYLKALCATKEKSK